MIKEQFFPTNIYGKDVKLDNQLFTNEIIEWSKRDPGVKKTNRNGWHSTTEMHKIPVFKPLVDELFIMMNDIWQEEWLDREPVLGNMWANINPSWHMDCDVNMEHEPPVRKISMTLLLNDPSEFEGGDLELMAPGKFAELKQGHAIIFASFINHRVNPVRRGTRQSLVVWFGGKPFR